MKKAYKIEIKPTKEQILKIHRTIGVSRFIYNFYIANNKETYERDKKFVSGWIFPSGLTMSIFPIMKIKLGLKKYLLNLLNKPL